MESYTDFAALYDTFMEETPYEEWCDYIVSILKKYNIEDGLVCDLGAGTGKMTRLLRDKGYDMIGIDNSEEMLMVAREQERVCKDVEEATDEAGFDAPGDILYLCQDMREFELYGTVRACISVCDSINYILDKDELITVFKLVNNYLDPDGIFVFDFNTIYKYEEVIGDATIAENRENESFIWDNYYDPESGINEYDITFFVREGEMYRKFSETHYQRGYCVSEMKEMIEAAGLVWIDAVDADTHKKVTKNSERVYVIAKEQGK